MLLRTGIYRQPQRFFTMARRVKPVRKSEAEQRPVATALNSDSFLAAIRTAEPMPSQSQASQQKHNKSNASSPVSAGLSLNDSPVHSQINNGTIDWSDSFHGLGQSPFPKEVNEILLAPIEYSDVEIKPDGILYMPEIKYRRILNRAFGPGGWGLAPRTQTHITPKQVSREYALVCSGRLVSIARGEQDYFGGEERLTTALEGCKSNALMRCCKDLGIASELWDPSFIRKFKKEFCDEAFAEHVVNKRKKKLWKLKVNSFEYPYKAC